MDTLRILFLNKCPRRSRSFHAPSGLALTSVQSASGLPTLARQHWHFKGTSESLSKTVTDPWLYGLYLSPDKCCLQVGRMFYLPFKRVPSSMSISATVTVGTWVEQLNDFKTASSSMFRNGYDSSQPPSECNLTERASENNPLQHVIRQLDNTYCIRKRSMCCQLQRWSILYSGHCAQSFPSQSARSQLHLSTVT